MECSVIYDDIKKSITTDNLQKNITTSNYFEKLEKIDTKNIENLSIPFRAVSAICVVSNKLKIPCLLDPKDNHKKNINIDHPFFFSYGFSTNHADYNSLLISESHLVLAQNNTKHNNNINLSDLDFYLRNRQIVMNEDPLKFAVAEKILSKSNVDIKSFVKLKKCNGYKKMHELAQTNINTVLVGIRGVELNDMQLMMVNGSKPFTKNYPLTIPTYFNYKDSSSVLKILEEMDKAIEKEQSLDEKFLYKMEII